MTLSLFEAINFTRHALARNLIDLLQIYGLKNTIIMYVKNEGSNLTTLTSALKFVVINIIKPKFDDLKNIYKTTQH